MARVYRAIGLMSGTSMDGVDVVLIESDGETVSRREPGLLQPYGDEIRATIARAVEAACEQNDRRARPKPVVDAETAVTRAHIDAVQAYLTARGLHAADIDVMGFHGQTLLHRPLDALTIQIGDGAELARGTGVDVVYDMRANDMTQGGQGAPLVPVYHRALVQGSGMKLPVAVVNIGGVANVTWIGEGGDMLAFDTGPGNAMLDDWIAAHTGQRMDENGAIAQKGQINAAALNALLNAPYFERKPPKSLDRNDFSLSEIAGMNVEDGAATLTAFAAHALARSREHMPVRPLEWIICGGGAHNPTLMAAVRRQVGAPVRVADDLGWSGAFMEAEAFGFLAIRSLRGLPLTFPGTTGVAVPATGGVHVTA